MAKRSSKRSGRRFVTRAELRAVQRALAEIKAIVLENNDALHDMRNGHTTSVRRIGELQAEIDRLKKLFSPSAA